MRLLGIITVLVIALAACDADGNVNVSNGRVVIDGTVYVVATAATDGTTESVASTVEPANTSNWERLDGEVSADILPSPVKSRVPEDPRSGIGGHILRDMTDVAYYDGIGSASWTLSVSSQGRLLVVDEATWRREPGQRFVLVISNEDQQREWQGKNNLLFVPALDSKWTVTVSASPGLSWNLTETVFN